MSTSFAQGAAGQTNNYMFTIGAGMTAESKNLTDQFLDAATTAIINGIASALGNLAMQATPYIVANTTIYGIKGAQFLYSNATDAIGYCYEAACDAYSKINNSNAEASHLIEAPESASMIGLDATITDFTS